MMLREMFGRLPRAYLAASWGRRAELCGYREALWGQNIHVTSRWIDEAGDGLPPGNMRCLVAAQRDLQDIREADFVLFFTDPPGQSTSRGGRHTELGYALALGKPVIVIGEPENIFQYGLARYEDFGWFLRQTLGVK